jgi:hypothetical protein
MGGGGAVRFLLKYPRVFNYAVSIDGGRFATPLASLNEKQQKMYGSLENFNANTMSELLKKCLIENPGIEKRIAIMLLSGVERKEVVSKFSSFLIDMKIENKLIVDTLKHDATLFYNKYLNEITGFERIHLCK